MSARAYRAGLALFGSGASWLVLAPCALASIVAVLGLLLMAGTHREGL